MSLLYGSADVALMGSLELASVSVIVPTTGRVLIELDLSPGHFRVEGLPFWG